MRNDQRQGPAGIPDATEIFGRLVEMAAAKPLLGSSAEFQLYTLKP
jgi:hypothetical protein